MKIYVNPHNMMIDKKPINEKEINITKCQFEFADEITDEYVKEAYFTYNGSTYKKIIVNNECDIPNEVLQEKGQVELGVVAYLVENEQEIKRYNPSPVHFETWIGSLKDAENSEPITPSEMEQYEQALNDGLVQVNRINIDAEKQDGVTTVTITDKDNVTKQVEILDGEKGETGERGPQGERGIQGPRGPQGERGLTGERGPRGETGPKGDTGSTGATGATGPTGPAGQKGDTGERGPAGRDGQDGQDGISPTVTTSKSGNTTTITITDKNGEHTATILDGTNGTNGSNGRDGYVQYTAGDNITIANNVISAIGGGIIAGKIESQIYLDEIEPGIYYFDNDVSKITINPSRNANGWEFRNPILFVIKEKYDSTMGNNNKFACLYYITIQDFLTFSDFYKSNGTLVRDMNSKGMFLTNNAQTITGVKTFSSIPKVISYSTPTDDTQLVAKKYVDDKIGDINTILATLTTPSNS